MRILGVRKQIIDAGSESRGLLCDAEGGIKGVCMAEINVLKKIKKPIPCEPKILECVPDLC